MTPPSPHPLRAGTVRGRASWARTWESVRLPGSAWRGQGSGADDGQCNLTDRGTEGRMTEDQLGDYTIGSPSRLALDVLAHKWTLLIVLALKGGPLRFTRLRSLVPGVTPQVLTDSLRELERDGMVVRHERPAAPPHVEYSLSELGASLCEPVGAIRAWAERNGPAVLAARQRYDSRAG